jgi:hypothetical protein
MKPRRLLAAAVLTALLTQLPTAAFAQTDADKATARELAKEGSDALEKKNFEVAADRFARADALFHAPTLVLGLARAQVGLGKLVAAQENYYAILREPLPPNAPEPFVQAVNDAKKELQALTPQVPWVIVSVAGVSDVKEAKVTLDDAPFPTAAIGVKRAVDPGEHTLRATAKGFKPAERRFTIAAAATETLELSLEPAPPETPDEGSPPPKVAPDKPSGGLFPNQDTVAIVALGVGGASLAAGVITGVLALGKRADLVEGGCKDGGACPPSQRDALGTYHTLGNISTGTFIGAGVLLTAGVVLLVTAPKAPKDPPKEAPATGVRVTPFVGLGHVGLTGTF